MRRTDWKARIIAAFGPLEEVKKTPYLLAVEPDERAKEFYAAYRYVSGDRELSLPEDIQTRYANEAAIFNMIDRVMRAQIKARQTRSPKFRLQKFWQEALEAVHSSAFKNDYPHKLPEKAVPLRRKFDDYKSDGYISLISGKWGNKNTEKINEKAKMWALAAWANQVERITGESHLLQRYNEKAKAEGWKLLKSPQTLHNFLYEPEIIKLWYGHRYGELNAKEKFTLYNSTKMPSIRDSLWYSDGTKLNYFYLDEDGAIKTTSVYEVMDASSEFMLGYHIADKENFDTQYRAYRMALQTAGHKPYEIVYDNQGGHKKLENSDFLNKLAHLSIRTKPYNGKSKTIESAFGRFQQEFLKRDWYFTGQNIQAKKQESKANMEFILANKENLPSLEEVKKAYERRRNEWNNAPHPKTGVSRRETYYSTINDQAPALQVRDYVELFWITRKSPVTYTADGLKFEEQKTAYKYLKYSAPMQPDFDFHFNNIGRKFIVKFDPEDMSMIYIYEKDTKGRLRFVTEMTTKVVPYRNKQEQEDWNAAYYDLVDAKNAEKRQGSWSEMDGILRDQEMHAENYGLVSPHLKGIDKPAKKGERKAHARKVKKTADWNKAMSEAVAIGDDDGIDMILDTFNNI
jgi:hypothetical protein